jgi:hypothetical protein
MTAALHGLVLPPWSAREGHTPSSRSWWLAFGGPWRWSAVGRSSRLARVNHMPSPVALALFVCQLCIGFSVVFLSVLVFCKYFSKSVYGFANIMGQFF